MSSIDPKIQRGPYHKIIKEQQCLRRGTVLRLPNGHYIHILRDTWVACNIIIPPYATQGLEMSMQPDIGESTPNIPALEDTNQRLDHPAIPLHTTLPTPPAKCALAPYVCMAEESRVFFGLDKTLFVESKIESHWLTEDGDVVPQWERDCRRSGYIPNTFGVDINPDIDNSNVKQLNSNLHIVTPKISIPPSMTPITTNPSVHISLTPTSTISNTTLGRIQNVNSTTPQVTQNVLLKPASFIPPRSILPATPNVQKDITMDTNSIQTPINTTTFTYSPFLIY